MEKDFLNLPVGSIFESDGLSYRVKESSDSSCSECSFYSLSEGCSFPIHVPFCYSADRSDGKNVYFEEV